MSYIVIPPEWNLNRFLVVLSTGFDGQDLQTAKVYIRENNLLKEDSLKSIASATDLFDKLREEQLLGSNDLEILKLMLHRIGKETLLNQAIAYSELYGRSFRLHHFENKTPKSGYEYINIYSRGISAGIPRTVFYHAFRSLISTVLFVPSNHLFIAGMERIYSTDTPEDMKVLLTVMIPNIYVSVFEKCLKDNTSIGPLRDLHIYLIKIKTRTFKIPDEQDETRKSYEDFSKMKTLLEESYRQKENNKIITKETNREMQVKP